MHGLDCDEMTVMWPNDCIILSFYYILSMRIWNVRPFVKEVFWLDAWYRLWWSDWFDELLLSSVLDTLQLAPAGKL